MEVFETSASSLSSGYYYSSTSSEEASERVPLLLHGETFKGWVFNQPIIAYLERDDGNYIFSDDIFGIYGRGRTFSEAVEDYGLTLSEYYELLKKHEHADAQSSEAFERLARFFSPKNEAQRDRGKLKK
jgi:hypothetical protein